MALFKLKTKSHDDTTMNSEIESFLAGYSLEVMPRTAGKIEDFRDHFPNRTRVYIAHIEGTPIEDMVATAKRIAEEGYQIMPHFPARIIRDSKTLEDWIKRYQGEAGVDQALLLAGGVTKPHGDFESSMQLMETGLFDKGLITYAFVNLTRLKLIYYFFLSVFKGDLSNAKDIRVFQSNKITVKKINHSLPVQIDGDDTDRIKEIQIEQTDKFVNLLSY